MLLWIILIFCIFISVSIVVFYIFSLYCLVKGAPYVSTNKRLVRKTIEMAEIKAGDKVYDLGCGDGRIVFEACRKGAIGTGIDVNLTLIWLARIKNIFLNLPAKFLAQDLKKHDWSDADVVFCYLLPGIMKNLVPQFQKLKPGTRIISHGFSIHGWEPVKHFIMDEKRKIGNVFVYRIGGIVNNVEEKEFI